MSMTENLLAFTLAATLLTLTPGLDTALVLRTATVEGKRQAVRAALGIHAGCLLWGAAIAFGLGAILAVSEVAYTALKYCGAAYLSWLGINMLLKPRLAIADANVPTSREQNWFIKGMLGNALNPKVGIFYVSFLPQFIPHGQPLIVWTFGLVGIHIILGLIWCMTLIAATTPFAKVLKRECFIKWMDRTTGVIFLAFAAKLIFSKR
ncbi:LysE family translocator [Pseudomonas sp. SGAir0191]|uniref:LysE family translocator n=1 Tax=Pseudomonas putida group TaxID=136845 RepID=UPI000C2CBCD6|nr:LysE family translocator [Pseudomonas sp. SGAir0191]AUA33346.1 LysE family translocator [Pseudomonas sp. SGAir0191]